MHLNSQKTIREPIELQGIGLHNGTKVNLFLKPAEVNTGIIFKRIDIDNSKHIIEASYKNVSSSSLCTKIKNSHGVSVSTIEHLMAAFYGEGIDNVLVEIDADKGGVRRLESILWETDLVGNVIAQWDFGDIVENYMLDFGDDPGADVAVAPVD